MPHRSGSCGFGRGQIGATGSPVPPAAFHWIRAQLGDRVPLVSMSGGTDIVSALATGAPTKPIWPGELSARPLGVAVDTWNEAGEPVRGTVGELVVTKPMPTMPVKLWNDPDGSGYRAAYFDVYPGVWRHGDWATITERGSVVIHGRSDATLNRNGIRLGSADIYEVVEKLPEVAEALVVGVDLPDGGYWMPLFVALEGDRLLDDDLRGLISDELRVHASRRHVPDAILQVAAIPHTRTSVPRHILARRLDLAHSMLKHGAADRTVDIAARCGFTSMAYFSQAFRRRYGVTAGEVRRSTGLGATEA